MADETIDLTRGLYRRIYANFIVGRRINSVPLEAEAWFWRILSVADDFGNLTGDPALLFVATVGRRVSEVTIDQVTMWTAALLKAELLDTYTVGNDVFLHVRGYLNTQSAGINGKRVRRVPASPWDDPNESGRSRVNPGESKRVRVKPGGNEESELRTRSTTTPAADAAATLPAPAPAFATTTTGRGWDLPCLNGTYAIVASDVAGLQAEFAVLDVVGEIESLIRHLRTHPSKLRERQHGLESVRNWLGYSMKNPSVRAKPPTHRDGMSGAPISTSARRESKAEQGKREWEAFTQAERQQPAAAVAGGAS